MLRVRHYSQRVESAYLNWIKRFILFHNKRHPAEMAERVKQIPERDLADGYGRVPLPYALES